MLLSASARTVSFYSGGWYMQRIILAWCAERTWLLALSPKQVINIAISKALGTPWQEKWKDCKSKRMARSALILWLLHMGWLFQSSSSAHTQKRNKVRWQTCQEQCDQRKWEMRGWWKWILSQYDCIIYVTNNNEMKYIPSTPYVVKEWYNFE